MMFFAILAIIYSGDITRVVQALFFSIVAVFWLLPLLFVPVFNIISITYIQDVHNFIITIVNNFTFFPADNFTLGFTVFIAVFYTTINFIVIISTIIVLIWGINMREKAEQKSKIDRILILLEKMSLKKQNK